MYTCFYVNNIKKSLHNHKIITTKNEYQIFYNKCKKFSFCMSMYITIVTDLNECIIVYSHQHLDFQICA